MKTDKGSGWLERSSAREADELACLGMDPHKLELGSVRILADAAIAAVAALDGLHPSQNEYWEARDALASALVGVGMEVPNA